MSPTARRLLSRAAIAVAASFVAVAALEIGLRVAAALAPGARPEPSPDGRPVVLFLGDSNMWGLNVQPDETLPARAEELSRTCCPPGFHAVNRGRIGAPSWVALEEAKAAIPKYKPVAVVVRIGLNNRFLYSPEEAWYDRFRVVRLARIALRNWSDTRSGQNASATPAPGEPEMVGTPDGKLTLRTRTRDGDAAPEFEVHHRMEGGQPVEREFATEVRPRLHADLVAIAKEAAQAGARTVFVSYLDDAAAFTNVDAELARAASESGSTYADVAALGRRALAVRTRTEVVYLDHHPTAVGYRLEANEVVRALLASGAIRGTPPEDPIGWLAALPKPEGTAISLAIVDPAALTFVVRTKPKGQGRLVVGRPGKSQFLQFREVPIADDDLSRRTRGVKELVFVADASGE
ncbi:MAG TPA: hypothetical protein VKE69_08990, partial [Planctomycetota bacterium]|nr:hypothetical protein [Planctomycetota bacterium]